MYEKEVDRAQRGYLGQGGIECIIQLEEMLGTLKGLIKRKMSLKEQRLMLKLLYFLVDSITWQQPNTE